MRIFEHIAQLEEFTKLLDNLRAGKLPCSIFGVADSVKPHLAAALHARAHRPVIVVCASDEDAALYAEADAKAVHIPRRPLQLRASVARSRERMFRRIEALSKITRGEARVVYIGEEALSARLPDPKDFADAHIVVKEGDVIRPEALMERLVLSGYERAAVVETAGQAARRGEVFDVFCPGASAPYRIDFFDDTVESIAEFDPGTQRRSRHKKAEALLPPAVELVLGEDSARRGAAYFAAQKSESAELKQRFQSYAEQLNKRRYFEDIESWAYACCGADLLDYLPGALVVFDEYRRVREAEAERFEAFEKTLKALIEGAEAVEDQAALYLPPLRQRVKGRDILELCVINRSAELSAKSEIGFQTRGALSYNKKMDLLAEDVQARVRNGWRVYLMCGSAARAEKLSPVLSGRNMTVPFIADGRDLMRGEAGVYADRLPSGFELTEQRTCFLGEHEIYGFLKKRKTPSAASRMDIFSDLKPGDLIIHDVHGKGRFVGLVKRELAGVVREYMELEYRDGDKLFIPTDQIDRVQKYVGGEGERLSKLGGREWSQTKARVKSAVKELAEDLISIYSERTASKGFVYGEDTVWQKQFEEGFPYEETGGQLRSIEEIKQDMRSDKVMDRLLLGDVGYGKTEVAMRACFKAVMEGRQCAVLVPTTLLARQHFHTFQERFSDFAVNIAQMSRFVSAAEQKNVLQGLKDGTVDLVIGTHRLLSQDVVFRDLGLLVIDEEQRFGVSHKERIKDLKRTVDVLTLSATPIPRTLQMSLTGIRDMSMIDTPPEERRAPESYVLEYSGKLVRDAVMKEIERGGQVYFVCRQIGQIDKLAGDLKRWVPEARVTAAHGRMAEDAMERVMVAYLAGEFDVLLCTTIIESGIDIPNVNTLIIYEADKFGLAQLYQLKGRVGRSTKSSYAYLTYLPGTRMTPEGEKRLQTIREFTELGAGFKIAMRDLEIRGAGNMLGPEQSGQMAAVGYDMYCRLMREAVAELRGKRAPRIADTSVEIRVSAHVPAEYIGDEMLRIEAYKKIAAVDGMQSAKRVREELSDRFGKLPKPVENLVMISLIKSFAARAGIAAVTRSGKAYSLKYGPERGPDLARLLTVLSRYPDVAQLKAAEPPYIVFKPPGGAVEELLKFLKDIRRCIIDACQV
jgi:transcription-repair coupling factor (superfamily II helicase)